MTREYKGDGRSLRVKDAYKGDAGRGRIRIDPDVINDLELRTGDVIEIAHQIAGKKTAALLFPGKEEDKGTNTIRMDSSLRRNINVSLDDIVKVRKIEASLADRITFAGLEESIILRTPQQLTQILENRVVTRGDILSFNAMGRRIDFVVIDYYPKADAVRIALDTKISISEKTSK
ncbi:MAG: AAA family ATPase, partial [Candidatus Odinarchaeota archaeon]